MKGSLFWRTRWLACHKAGGLGARETVEKEMESTK